MPTNSVHRGGADEVQLTSPKEKKSQSYLCHSKRFPRLHEMQMTLATRGAQLDRPSWSVDPLGDLIAEAVAPRRSVDLENDVDHAAQTADIVMYLCTTLRLAESSLDQL